MRRAVLVPLVVVVAWPLSGVTAASPATTYDSNGATWNILPPGSNGNVNAADLAAVGPSRTATATTPTNFADQLEMYDALNTISPYSLKASNLSKYYKDASMGDPADPASTETPKTGVTITRDQFGVPHITGTTDDDVAYGAGYAGIEDRMFLTDVLRHVGAGQMASFLAPTDG